MADYKGIYYKDESKQRYFEGGAHFKYMSLYKVLEKLSSAQKLKLKREELNNKREIKKKEKPLKKKESIAKNINNVSKIFFIIIIKNIEN